MTKFETIRLQSGATEPQFRIVEIFKSLQGEGFNTGMPATFVRLGRCNLACGWCDTNYNSFGLKSLSEILQIVEDLGQSNIILTGGEPSVHPNVELLIEAFKSRGYYLCIETNGISDVPEGIDYIAISPKYCYKERYEKVGLRYADEIRIVVDFNETNREDFLNWLQDINEKFNSKKYYLSPLEHDGSMNIQQTIKIIGELNGLKIGPRWELSLQTHKLAGIE
ncbi:7-carboxy-7-deazaguanine synthase QueE [Taylorella equigenitalis]|uniref:7-carboxy-7-deazaguanine synthase n=3 Tax=Taylorella equigenitalis TaxID=29575 RepID=A0A654KHE2_TAYEM|nr:7-carboxy-7-deazaguanine synthase QueE [Taylorella equigenitalis]ADU91810.1 Queuosine Biosynthesis QueE Radical SAM [Taylorella equigenitalis MCE9]ASY40330.1 radical SAM protein [Taylorella equigenitalis]WDU46627.1 7-carboxy-7-deazaguanine synthase QueE [Taylorella equigenitalis]WDU53604.1 7-carboxy-7-deazaguanine synthase QueE [Taylorella equigenitalis]WDU56589.1 7-carboxy-7-deazaguanine synthase QueE [Taylorella equigenitalis]